MVSLTGCVFIPRPLGYKGPEPRPEFVQQYYQNADARVLSATVKVIKNREEYTEKEITICTTMGDVVVDLFQQHEKNDDLIFVFPVLGGKYMFERYFARYFAERGFDTAIVRRNNEFRNPANIDRIEEIFRENIIRDRLVLDYFEEAHGKRDFGSFGISRGAINASMLAGVDERLKHNVLVLGGSNLVGMFRSSGEKGIKKFIKKVTDAKQISRDELFRVLEESINTDPRYVAKYIDARNTLLILGLFDQSVPVRYGLKLRRQIGEPETVVLMSGHYTSLLFTQFVQLIPPGSDLCVFPYDLIETEALSFYNRTFKTGRWSVREIPVRIFKLPMSIVGRVWQLFF
jgi:hypothetical protein